MTIALPAIFLDRDGTINCGTERVLAPEQLILTRNAAQAIRRLNQARYLTIIVTNQSAIARGLLTTKQFNAIQQHLYDLLAVDGANIDATYHCPHHPKFDTVCTCRKPNSGLIQQACHDFNIDMERSWFIGDTTGDIKTAHHAGLKSILVCSGYGGQDQQFPIQPNHIAVNLSAAVDYLLNV